MRARPLDHFTSGVSRLSRIRRADGQVGPRLHKVIVVGGPLAGYELVDDLEVEEMLLVDTIGTAIPAQGVVGGARETPECAIAIGQDQPVFAVRVLEEPGNPPFFGEALEECKIRLPKLDLVLPLWVTCHIQPLLDRKGVVGEQIIQNLDDSLLLEDLVVGGEGGEP